MASAAGLKTRLEISAAGISWPSVTATPSNNKVPLDGRVSIETWSKLSPSTSLKPNSLSLKV